LFLWGAFGFAVSPLKSVSSGKEIYATFFAWPGLIALRGAGGFSSARGIAGADSFHDD